MSFEILYSIIIILIIVVIIWKVTNYRKNREYINGYYTGDPDFLDSAHLDEFVLFIKGNTGFIIVSNEEGDIIENTKITISIYPCYKKNTFNVTIKEQTILPNKMKLTVDPYIGYLHLFDGKKTYAILVKDLYRTVELL